MSKRSGSRFQHGNIDTILIGVLVFAVVATVVIYLYMDYSHSPESDAALNYPEFTAINEMEGVNFSVWSGTMSCTEAGPSAPFSRKVSVYVSPSLIAYEDGEVAEFLEATGRGAEIPAELKQRFEFWRGRINGNQIVAKGVYTEGADGVKYVSYSGGFARDRIFLEGQRGPRWCQLDIVPEAE